MTPQVAQPLALGGSRVAGWCRLFFLYARGRGLPVTAALTLVVLGLIPLLRHWASFDDSGGWGDLERLKQFGVVQVIPALVGAIIGISTWSPLGETERTSVSALTWLRAIHLGGLLGAGMILAWIGFAAWDSRTTGVALALVAVRNLAGYTGMALMAARLVDARLSWLAPLAWCTLAVFGAMVEPIERLWTGPAWQWSSLGSCSAVGWAVGLMLGGAGMAAGVWYGPRDGVPDPGEG